MNNLSLKLRKFVPARLKRAAKEKLREWKLKRAVTRIGKLPLGQVPTTGMLRELQAAWGNEGYAARTEYLEQVAMIAATTSLPILECGSGLTTILVGLLAGRRGVKTYSLEHIQEWRERINATLERLQISQVQVSLTPLREYDGYTWYDAPLADLPEEFGLVICDGPPGATVGGRYGLMPVFGARLPAGSIILLDDTERTGELDVLRRWATETNIKISSHETPTGSFAVVTRLESEPTAVPRSIELRDRESKPAVSVIIPAYNVASLVCETLDSVFSQTFTAYEVILVNDGSLDTEELERALEPYGDRLRYFKQENAGASVARNLGLRAARGDLVAFLDADDMWLPNYLEEQVKFLGEHDCDLVCADAMIFGDSPDAGRTYMEWLMDAAPAVGGVTFLDLVSADRSLITSGVVTRRELIFAVGLFDEKLRNAQDFDLWLRLARHGARLAYQRKLLLRYRCRGNSLTGDTTNSLTRELRVLDKIEQSYDLTPTECTDVMPVIQCRMATLQFELGKLLLARGDVAGARAAFVNASNSRRSWKTLAARCFSRLAPGLFQSLYSRHLRNAHAE